MSLDPEVVQRLERLGADSTGKGNLSAGIAIAEHATRGMDLARYQPPIARVRVGPRRNWIVYELTDEPADPPPPIEGCQVDAWREA